MRSRAVILVTLLLPILTASASDFVVSPTYVRVHAWVGDPAQVSVNVTPVGGTATLDFVCDEKVTPPPNGTVVVNETELFFQINTTTQYYGFQTCLLISNDARREVTFEVTVEEPPREGKLTLSSTSLSFNQTVDTVRSYPNVLYATNGYKWSANVSQVSSPLWIHMDPVFLLPGETKPINLTVDTRGLIEGAHYSGLVVYKYVVANFTFQSSFQVSLYVQPRPTPTTTERKDYYILSIGVLDRETAKPVAGATVIVSREDFAVMRLTNETGYATFQVSGGLVYQYKVLMQGYEEYDGSVVVDTDKTVLVLIRKTNETNLNVTLTTTTQSEGSGPTPGTLFIPYYNASITVAPGYHNAVSVPVTARGGYVNLSVQPVELQPEWISASVSHARLMDGETAFIQFSASPPNGTALGKYVKRFYIAHNADVSLFTLTVDVVSPKRQGGGNRSNYAVLPIPINGSTSIEGERTVPRPSYLKVPIVSVLLGGSEGLVPGQEAEVVQGDVVYVIVQGDPSYVRIVPSQLALLGAEPRPDGVVYRYQVKDNGQLDVKLVYYNPLTGQETYERPQEFGYGIYRFKVIAKEKKFGIQDATLYLDTATGVTRYETADSVRLVAWIEWPNGTKSSYNGVITFKFKHATMSNMTEAKSVNFANGNAVTQFVYAGTYIPQVPQSWKGKFVTTIGSIVVEYTEIDMNFNEQLYDGKPATVDLDELHMDIYKIEIYPPVRRELSGGKLIFYPKAGEAYEIKIYGYSRDRRYDVLVDMTTKVATSTLESTASTFLVYGGGVAIAIFIGWSAYKYFSRRTRRRGRPEVVR